MNIEKQIYPTYSIADNRLLKSEFYGTCWEISRTGSQKSADPVVIVPDPGDGSARRLSELILGVLNSEKVNIQELLDKIDELRNDDSLICDENRWAELLQWLENNKAYETPE